MTQSDIKRIEEFYNALNESQKSRVEVKLRTMLKESYSSLPEPSVNLIRYQIASDLFQLLQD